MQSSGRFSRPWWVETRRRRGYSTMATIRRSPVLQLSMLACAVLAAGCPSRDRNIAVSGATSAHTATAAMSATATAGDVSSPGQQAAVHDPAHPPIDCPLRKQGLDPAHLRPFEDTAKYIAFLERPDRAAWQKPDAVVAALGLTGKETIVDVGAGSGYFSFRLARVVPEGKVIALDVDPEMIRHIHHKAMTEGVRNVQVAFAKPDDPGVPAEADLVFMCDVLHHIQDRPAWLAKLAAQMHKGARLALVEFKEGKLPEGPPEALKLSRAQLVALATGAGLVLDSEKPDLLPYQTFLVFRKAG
jgi:2-polyprenyl-3-methyl-5-hydroxy-6-metoxy-1,4-benzoquinol methylase